MIRNIFKAVALSWLALLTTTVSKASNEQVVLLEETCPPGYQYHVSCRSNVQGEIKPPEMKPGNGANKAIRIAGNTSVEYDERVLEAQRNKLAVKTLRIYRRLDFRRRMGDRTDESTLRPAVRRLVLLRMKQSEVPFSPDGPLTWGEIDMVRMDVFTPALCGLLPGKAVSVGDTWRAEHVAIEELADYEEITSGTLDCSLQEVATRDGRRYARVGLSGTITGVNEDGPNRQQLDGYYFFDLKTNHLSYLYLTAVSWLLDKDGKERGKIEGRFVLTRKLLDDHSDLANSVVRRLTLSPTDENTQLLFDEPAMGVRFVYPRRWTVRQADARQITLNEPRGGGLLITLEPKSRTPTGTQFQTEVRNWLNSKSKRVLSSRGVQSVFGVAAGEQFSFEAEFPDRKAYLDYYVVPQNAGGATFAGTYPLSEADELKEDVLQIVRSLKLAPPK